jgi:iron complex outermembrane receptor protein
VIIPNPDIQPERGWSAEMGIKQGFLLGKVTGQADLSLFLMQNTNLIEFYFGSYAEGVGFRATNVEEAHVYGAELEFNLSRRLGAFDISASGGYTFIYPVDNSYPNRDEVVYLKYRRMHAGKLYLVSSRKRLHLGVNLSLGSKILNIDDVFLHPATSELFLPGFYAYWQNNNTGHMVLDVIPGYRINDRFTLSFAVKNLTNTEYMGRPGDIQPHRNFSLRLSGRF